MNEVIQEVLAKLAVNGEIRWGKKLYRLDEESQRYRLVNPETNDFYE